MCICHAKVENFLDCDMLSPCHVCHLSANLIISNSSFLSFLLFCLLAVSFSFWIFNFAALQEQVGALVDLQSCLELLPSAVVVNSHLSCVLLLLVLILTQVAITQGVCARLET